MLGNGHVRFGRRAAETDQSKDRHRAAARPHTEHPTREGKLYCCVILDVFSRRVVGWSIDSHQATPLVTNALGMAISNRDRAAEQTVIHSDHGTQFTSWAFTQRAKNQGCSRQWAASATATTTPSSKHSGVACRLNS